MSKKVIFAGCSFTAGVGLVDGELSETNLVKSKEHPDLWVNLCYNGIKNLKKHELINVSSPGASNTEIFEYTIDFITKFGKNIDTIFCQWTSAPRYNFQAGFELWNTTEGIDIANWRKHDIRLSDGTVFPRKYLLDLLDRIKVMHHLHWEIVKIVKYSNIISELAKSIGIKNVFHINGLCPWDENYFIELKNSKPSDYTKFTRTEILNINTRSDKDIHELYSRAHQHYRDVGGVDNIQWINLYNSFYNQIIDTNFDKVHPGTKTNQIYYQIISNRLQELNFY